MGGTFVVDLRYGMRMFIKSPTFIALAILTIALGIGANATIFSWVNAILLKPLPGVADPEGLVAVVAVNQTQRLFTAWSYPNYRDIRDRCTQLDGLAAYTMAPLNMNVDAMRGRVWGMLVSHNYFDVLRIHPFLGSGFSDEGSARSAHHEVLISYGLWQRSFAGSASVIGKSLILDQVPFTIVGVTPPLFQGSYVGLKFDLWLPLELQPEIIPGDNRLENRKLGWLSLMGRLRTNAKMQTLQAELNVLAKVLAAQFPQDNQGIEARVYPLSKSPEEVTGILAPVFYILFIVAGLVLLMACVNVGNLLLERSAVRRREFAIRISLGANRWRLVRQLLTEGIWIWFFGGVAAVVLTLWTSKILTAFVPPARLPIVLQSGIDKWVILFTFFVSVMSGVVFEIFPAIRIVRMDLRSALSEAAGTLAGNERKSRLRNWSVIAQISLSVLLLIAAGLLIRSLAWAKVFNPGFTTGNVVLGSIDLFADGYGPERGLGFYRQTLTKLGSEGNIRSVTLAQTVPLGFGGGNFTRFSVPSYHPAPNESMMAAFNVVGPDYFRTMEIPLIQGRDFVNADSSPALPVAIVNKAFVDRYWKAAHAIGGSVFVDGKLRTVIAVSRNIDFEDLDETPVPAIYLPLFQDYQPQVTIHARFSGTTDGAMSTMKQVVHELDSQVFIFDTTTLQEHVGAATFQQHLAAAIFGAFGLLALLLAAIGAYGVVAYATEQRSREIGIRLALGAQHANILWLVFKEGLVLSVIGVLLGIAAAAGVTRLLNTFLFGVKAVDLITFAAVSLTLIIVVFIASYAPARRAMSVDPASILRQQ